MNLKLELLSLDILQSIFFSIFALFGDVMISYINVMTLSFPLPSPISLLYKSKGGRLSFVVLCFFLELSLIWWIIGALSSSFRSIHMSSSWIAFLFGINVDEESNGVFFVCAKLVNTKVGVISYQSIEDT